MKDGLQSQIYEFSTFRLDTAKRLLLQGDGEIIPLTPKIFETLLYLVENNGKVIEKDELMQAIWTDTIVEENNLNKNISVLRRVLGEKPGEHRFIVTVPGHGYKFVADIRKSEPPADELNAAELQISNDKLQTENQSEIEHLKSETDQRPKPDNQLTKDNEQRTTDKSSNRFWLVAVCGAFIVGLSLLGFYAWRETAKSADAPLKTIAVLPFKPLVLENRSEALEFGMADTLISKLSGGEEIIVRPLSAIRRYNSVEQDSLTAGRELGVESVLDGTIQNWGDRIRVSAKLLRVSDGKQLWAGQFDEKFTDIFVVQDSISEKVAAALKIRLANREKKHATENIEAYQLYMNGRYRLDKLTPPDIRAGIPYFRQAIDLDPNYALAYTGLTQSFGVLVVVGAMPASEGFPQAKAAAKKAIELDDTLPEAHIALCMGMFADDWNWSAAEKECLRGIELDPNNAESHGNFAFVLSNTGATRGSSRRIKTLART